MPSEQVCRGSRFASQNWRARVAVNGVHHYLGSYPSQEIAAYVEDTFRAQVKNLKNPWDVFDLVTAFRFYFSPAGAKSANLRSKNPHQVARPDVQVVARGHRR